MSSIDLNQKTIVIIGGTSGIGLAGARACLEAGANVWAIGVQVDECRALLERHPDQSAFKPADAMDPRTAAHAIQQAAERFGKLDGLFHVAGGSGRKWGDGPLHEITDEGWDKTLQLNLSSVFYSNRAAIQQFIAQKSSGSIVNIASVLADSPAPHFFQTHAYAAAKSSIIGMSKSAAAFYANLGVRINVIAPGLTETPMSQRAMHNANIMEYIKTKQPLDGGRVGRPEDLGEAIVYFLSDASRFITGQTLAIDGGWSVSEGQF